MPDESFESMVKDENNTLEALTEAYSISHDIEEFPTHMLLLYRHVSLDDIDWLINNGVIFIDTNKYDETFIAMLFYFIVYGEYKYGPGDPYKFDLDGDPFEYVKKIFEERPFVTNYDRLISNRYSIEFGVLCKYIVEDRLYEVNYLARCEIFIEPSHLDYTDFMKYIYDVYKQCGKDKTKECINWIRPHDAQSITTTRDMHNMAKNLIRMYVKYRDTWSLNTVIDIIRVFMTDYNYDVNCVLIPYVIERTKNKNVNFIVDIIERLLGLGFTDNLHGSFDQLITVHKHPETMTLARILVTNYHFKASCLLYNLLSNERMQRHQLSKQEYTDEELDELLRLFANDDNNH